MKTCQTCGSKTFDDMETCYDCMSSFVEPVAAMEQDNYQKEAARLQVALAGYFKYELLLNKLDGRSLSVGSDSENAIVIPLAEVAAHQLEVFYAHGHVWVESLDSSLAATVDTMPLCGTVCVKSGVEISVGDATITVLQD